MRSTNVASLLIRVLQVPFKNPTGFENVKGFNPQGISMDDIKDFPRFKAICWNSYDLLADVKTPPLLFFFLSFVRSFFFFLIHCSICYFLSFFFSRAS